MKYAVDQRNHYMEKGIDALRGMYDLGLAHGASKLRNMTMLDDQIYFLDFEHHFPQEHLADYQVKDMFLLLLSLEKNHHDPDIKALCAEYAGIIHLICPKSFREPCVICG